MNPEHRQRNLRIAIFIAVIAILALAMTLRSAPTADPDALQKLWAFLFGEMNQGNMFAGNGTVDRPYGQWIVNFVRYVYFAALLSFPISILLAMLDPDQRKRVIRSTVFLLILAAIVLAWSQRPREPQDDNLFYPLGTLMPTEQPLVLDDAAFEYEPQESPTWLVWAIAACIALLVSAGIVLTINRLRKHPPDTLITEELTHPVRNAISALEDGENFNDTILQCYFNMMRTVEAYRGLRKGDTITASEFIESLLKAGLPENAVRDLTYLFESVRYGEHKASIADENTAIDSLKRIALRLEEATHE